MTVEPDLSPVPAEGTRVPEDEEQPGRLARWAARHRIVLVVLGMVVAHAVWRAAVLRDSWFGEDDFVYVTRAHDLGLSRELLFARYGGHFMPGGFLLTWLDTALSPLGWGLVVAQTALLSALGGLAFWHLLRTVFGPRPVLLAPLALYLLSPLTLPAANWWAAGLNALPLQIALCMAMASQVRYARSLRGRDAAGTTAWTAVGLLFFVKAVLLFPTLFVLTGVLGFAGSRRVSWRTVLVRYRRGWALQTALLAAYVVLYLLAPQSTETTSAQLPRSPVQLATLLGNGIGRVLAPGLLGGPWSWRPTEAPTALAQPPFLAVWLSVLVVGALVLAACVARRRGAWAWALVGGYACACLAIVATGRLNQFDGGLALETHYLADCVPLLLLALTFTLLPVQGEAGPALEPGRLHLPEAVVRNRAVALLAALVAVSTSSVYSVHAFQEQRLPREQARRYVETARAELAAAPDDLTLYDRRVQQSLMSGLFVDGALTSEVLGPVTPARLGRRPYLPVSEAPQAFDDDGRLRRVGVDGVQARKGPDPCGWLVSGTSAFVPLESALFDYDWTVRVGYLSSRDAVVQVGFGRTTVDAPVHEGLGQLVFRALGPGSQVRFDVPEGTSLCIGDAQVGNLALLP